MNLIGIREPHTCSCGRAHLAGRLWRWSRALATDPPARNAAIGTALGILIMALAGWLAAVAWPGIAVILAFGAGLALPGSYLLGATRRTRRKP
jgi:uncharacterized membrane protein